MTKLYFQSTFVQPSSRAASIKEIQAIRIAQLRDTLVACGLTSLDQQARALGLGRSTCWQIGRAAHKGSGLSASILARMLSSPTLPSAARRVTLQYIEEKSCGLYGHNPKRIRQFQARLQSLYLGDLGILQQQPSPVATAPSQALRVAGSRG